MRYTIRAGVERPYLGLTSDSSRFILPLIVILAGVLYFTLHPYHFSKPTNPMTLGVYTIKTPDKPSGGSGNDSSGSSSNTTPQLSTSAQPISFDSGVIQSTGAVDAAGGTLNTSTAPLVGGRGGGDTGSTTTPPVTVTVPAITTVSTGCTIAIPSVCGACSSPISLTAGQKSVLTATGQCVAVDP